MPWSLGQGVFPSLKRPSGIERDFRWSLLFFLGRKKFPPFPAKSILFNEGLFWLFASIEETKDI